MSQHHVAHISRCSLLIHSSPFIIVSYFHFPGLSSSNTEDWVSATSGYVIQLGVQGLRLLVRFYISCLLIAYHWVSKFVEGAFKPFQPVIAEVQKVPKKDVSAEGIFYQFLRLQFLVVLYMAPYGLQALTYLAQPIVWARDWLLEFARWDESKHK